MIAGRPAASEASAWTSASPLVSIVVPARNEEGAIEGCIASLLAQSYPPDRIEILVVDGRSTDRTRDVVGSIAARDARVRLLDNPAGVTPVALNIGWRAARGDVVGVMSAHATAPSNYVAHFVAELQRTGASAVGGAIHRIAEGPVQTAIAAATMSPFGLGNATHNYGRVAQWVETVFPAMWPRAVLVDLDGFDPELVRNQDDEFHYRLRQRGGRIWYDPQVRFEYQPRATLRKLFSQYRQYGYWKVRVLQKHPRALRWRHFVPAAWIATVVLAPGAALAGRRAVLPFVGAIGAYGAFVGFASLRLRRPGTAPGHIATALATLHAAYGIGFWQGVARFVIARRFAERRSALTTP